MSSSSKAETRSSPSREPLARDPRCRRLSIFKLFVSNSKGALRRSTRDLFGDTIVLVSPLLDAFERRQNSALLLCMISCYRLRASLGGRPRLSRDPPSPIGSPNIYRGGDVCVTVFPASWPSEDQSRRPRPQR